MPMTGVAGWPVAHSRSPALHRAAFRELGVEGWDSQLLPIPPEVFAETVTALPGSGFRGINVTIPHKAAALGIADSVSEVARRAGAANTLTFERGAIDADNTDVAAIESAARELIGESAGSATALVLGAGGSARAALVALEAAGFGAIEVWNRTHSRAEEVVSDLGGAAVQEVGGFDLLINTTSVGLDGHGSTGLADLPISVEQLRDCAGVVDLVYGSEPTPVEAASTEAGAAFIGGLEILVRQGALSIGRWLGEVPGLDPLREAVAAPR